MGCYKERIPLSIVPNWDMASPAYELDLPLTIASCTFLYSRPIFMAEISFKASKEFRLNFNNLVLALELKILILRILQFL